LVQQARQGRGARMALTASDISPVHPVSESEDTTASANLN